MSSVFETRDFKFYKKNFDSLAKIPFVRQLLKENEKLKKENADLKHTVFKLCKKMLEKEETKIDEQDDDSCCEVVLEKEEKENIVYEIEEDEDIEDEINKIKVKTEVVEEEEEEEEVVVEEEEEEEVVVEEEEEEEEEVVVEEEEEEEEEVVVEEEEEEEEEVVVEEEEEEEEDEVYEITIQSKTYYVTNEIDSIIYEADASGDISIEAGIYKNGTPTFYKK
jgi:hypothetical protein